MQPTFKLISIINIISKLLILPLTFIFVKKPDDYLFAAFIQSMVYLFGSFMACYLIIRNKYITNCIKTTKEQIGFMMSGHVPDHTDII